jgi:hypothetical protein
MTDENSSSNANFSNDFPILSFMESLHSDTFPSRSNNSQTLKIIGKILLPEISQPGLTVGMSSSAVVTLESSLPSDLVNPSTCHQVA